MFLDEIHVACKYTSKKDIQSDVTFFMVMSVSVLSFPILTAWVFCNLLSMSVYLLIFSSFFRQLLSSTMSVFWGVGIGCLVEYFENDIEKVVHAFYPLFKKWVQLDYHNLKKLSDLSISIRRYTFGYFFQVLRVLFTIIYYYPFVQVNSHRQCAVWSLEQLVRCKQTHSKCEN